MEKLRVLKFLNVFAIGGTERQFVNIVQRLDPQRFDLHIGCFRKWGAFLPAIEACGLPVTAFNVKGMISSKTVATQLQFARYLREHRIQVLHTYGWYANVFGIPAAKLAGVPVTIASIRDTGAHQTNSQLKVQKAVTRLASCVLANSDAVRDWLLSQGYRREKLRVIRNGIVPESHRTPSLRTIREELGIPQDAPLVGTVCRLSPVKALSDFVNAAAITLRQHPEARFLIIGDGEERIALTKQVQQAGILDRVIFTGFRTDTAQILPQLTVSVLSSLTEGLSNTLLESMSAGLPVVATRVGGNPEIIADGVTGILVPARNPEALSEAIGRLLSDSNLARQMGAAGRERIRQQFSVDNAVHQTEELYQDLLRRWTTAA
jgi:L-malate glycosyltransferase